MGFGVQAFESAEFIRALVKKNKKQQKKKQSANQNISFPFFLNPPKSIRLVRKESFYVFFFFFLSSICQKHPQTIGQW